MTNKTFDASNWREEYKNYTSSKTELELLEKIDENLSNFSLRSSTDSFSLLEIIGINVLAKITKLE